MQPFKLELSNGATLAGIHALLPRSASSPNRRPLVVGLHGSTYDCHYFDADASHTAYITSSAFGVPFISIDRPGYGGTTSFTRPEGSSFPKETGAYLHRYILPALWVEYGLPNGCNCVILLCHSLGAMGGIITAAMHAQDNGNALYPLGGVIVSDIGDKLRPEMKENPIREPNIPPDQVSFPIDIKDALMFRPGTVHPDILKRSEQLNSPSPLAEIESLRDEWLPSWRDAWAQYVKAPLMLGLAEEDCFFEGTQGHVRDLVSMFPQSVRVDGSLIRKAPHCLELSYWSHGWYARCFGFAMECSAGFDISS